MRAIDYIRELTASDRQFFTTTEALQAVGRPLPALRAQLRRLKLKGMVAEPVRGFHIIVPPEFQHLGCVPAEHFVDQLMTYWGEPYYLCLLSAAECHGAAHQRSQTTQVIVRKNRHAIECGRVRVQFIARGALEAMPVTTINTPLGSLRYSTPEVTALELVGYPYHAGELENVTPILSELAGKMDAEALLEAAQLCPVSWSQRLGYLLELFEQKELARALLPFVEKTARSFTPLRRAAPIAGGHQISKWKLIVNVGMFPKKG